MEAHVLPCAPDRAWQRAPEGDAWIFFDIINYLVYHEGVAEVEGLLIKPNNFESHRLPNVSHIGLGVATELDYGLIPCPFAPFGTP